MSKIKVIGVDMAFANMGLAFAEIDVVGHAVNMLDLQLVCTEARGGKQVRKSSDDLRRGRALFDALYKAASGATLVMAEVPGGSQSARAAKTLGIATGVLACCPVPVVEVDPSEVKLAAVGKKTASKAEMIEWAMTLYPHLPWLTVKRKGQLEPTAANEHLADAAAAIHAGLLTEQFRQTAAIAASMKAAS